VGSGRPRKFCSSLCRAIAHGKRHDPSAEIKCVVCGKSFTARHKKKICGAHCKRIHLQKTATRGCQQCGRSFRLASSPHHLWCSHGCYLKACTRECVDCGDCFTATRSIRTRCNICHKRNRNRAASVRLKHRRKKAREANTTISVHEIWQRDGGRCQYCSKRINWNLKWPHPKSMSVDHIIPLSKGGSDESVNLQAMHLRCNIRRSNTTPGQLRFFG
jgi:DNA-directed RNA polymerase subunit RPC12/RpoP